MQRFIVVNLQVEGAHKWGECPFNEVGYLRHSHRHIFHIKAVKEVSHNDRDIEIIMLKQKIQDKLHSAFRPYHTKMKTLDFGNMSCEAIAEYLINEFQLYSCEVLEDGENGAFLITSDILPI